MKMLWMHLRGLFFLFMMVGTISGMDTGSSSLSLQISMLASQLSTLGSQLIQLQEQVEVLQHENMEDKERIVHLEQVTEEFERKVSLLESICGSTQIETEIQEGPLMAIGGLGDYDDKLRTAEVVNTSCNFPLPSYRYGHMSVTTADGKTLVCGGLTPYGVTASCLQFNYESKTWEEHSSLNDRYRYYGSAIALKNGVYLMGGRTDETKTSSEFLATGSSVWTQGPDIPFEGVFDSCAVKLSETEFVIIGGIPGNVYRSTQVRVYNVERDEWKEWPRLTEGVEGPSCVGLGDKVLMAGGMDSNGYTRRTVIFDTKTGSAREVASLKYPRGNAAMALYKGKPLILGGNDGGYTKRSDGEMWNMDTETWEEAEISLNPSRSSFSLVTMAEEIECN